MFKLGFILLVVAGNAVASVPKCPANSQWSSEYGYCYLPVPFKAPWYAAEGLCRNMGGHLPSILNEDHNQYLYQMGKYEFNNSFWIGAYAATFNKWYYTDGTKMSYTNWAPVPYNAPNVNATKMAINEISTLYGINFNNSQWLKEPQGVNNEAYFICELPSCSNGSKAATSLLGNSTTGSNWGLIYGSTTNAWYYIAGSVSDVAMPVELDETACSTVGGHMTSIRNAFENSEIMAMIKAYTRFPYTRFALGLESDYSGHYYWTDGSPVHYTNWAPLEPMTISGERMFALIDYYMGHWYATMGSQPGYAMCQFRNNMRNWCQ